MARNALLIAATDTEVGKTVLTSAIAAYWRKYAPQRSLGILKPIQAGAGDRELYARLFDLDKDLQQSPEELNPVYFDAPLAPPVAAAQVGQRVDLARAWQTFQHLQQRKDFVLVEALGGLGSPVTAELTVADLARDWRLPVLLVVPVRLGAIAHTVANAALARQTNVNLRGIILNCPQARSPADIETLTPISLLQTLTHLPVLGCIPHLPDPQDLDKLAQVASQLDLDNVAFPLN